MSVLLLLTTFSILLAALCPTVYVGDSGLFASASFSLGSAHPPGYPLYVTLGKLFTFMPFGNVALKVNILNSFFGALTCLMVFKVSMELTENKYASWAAALICGISPLFFIASLNAKGVYTLNSFLSMVMFYLAIRLFRGKNFVTNSLLGFFIVGLGMGNHHTIALMGLVFLLPVAIRWRDITLRWIFLSILIFFVGFSVNLELYLRAVAMERHGSLILFSYVPSWKDFLRVFLRQDYKGAATTSAVSGLLHSGNGWFYGLRNSLYYVAFYSTRPVLPFLLLGLICLRKKKNILLFFILSFIVWFVLLGKMVLPLPEMKIDNIQTVSVYFLAVIPILYCLTAMGFDAVIAFIRKRRWKIIPKVIPYAFMTLPFVLLPYSMNSFSQYNNFIAYDYGHDMLSVLPLKSMFLAYNDNPIFITFYMKTVERLREDLLVMNTGSRKDVYDLESSPPWKYSELYPDFYRQQKSSIRDITGRFALQERLFASTPTDLTKNVSKSYLYYPYIFSVALWPKSVPAEDFKRDIRSRFKANYGKIDYERALDTGYLGDFLAREVEISYAFNTMIYADFLKREGEEKRGNELYKKAFEMGPPEGFLWPYVNFLLQDGREKEAFAFIDRLKKAGGIYGRFGELLGQEAVSVVKEKTLKGE